MKKSPSIWFQVEIRLIQKKLDLMELMNNKLCLSNGFF